MDRERMAHGAVNEVHDRGDGTVEKRERSIPAPLYRSLEREVAACRAMADSGSDLAPVVVDTGAGWARFGRIDAPPLPETWASRRSAEAQRLSAALGRALAAVHLVEPDGRRPALALPYAGPTWRASLLTGLSLLCSDAGRRRSELAPMLRRVESELGRAADVVPEQPSALVHADFGGANLLVDPARPRVVGVVDWEWAVWGDPDLDLARIAWLGAVGRSSRLWVDEAGRAAFHAAYAEVRPGSSADEVGWWYGRWLACSTLDLLLAIGAAPATWAPLVRYLDDGVSGRG